MSAAFQSVEKIAIRNLKQLERSCMFSSVYKRYASSKNSSDEKQWRKSMYNVDGTIKDYYEILGVESSATRQEIQKAYYELNKLLHPDSRIVNNTSINTSIDDKNALIKLGEAQESYHVLRSRKKRAEYDSERRRISMLFTPDVEELVHDITGWVAKTDKNKATLHEKFKEIQYQNFKRYKKENNDPNTFIQMAHKKILFNRKLAHEQEIDAKQSIDIKLRRKKTLNYKLWKERMERKNKAFSNKQTLDFDIDSDHIQQLSDINKGNQQYYQQYYHQQYDNDSNNNEQYNDDRVDDQYRDQYKTSFSGPTPNAYYHDYNPRAPFGGDMDKKTNNLNIKKNDDENKYKLRTPEREYKYGTNPENYDENVSRTMKEDQKIKIQRTVDVTPGIGATHDDIKGDYSSNPDQYKYQHDEMRKRVYSDWKEKQRENKYKYKSEPLQIEGKIDETANSYTWYENVGSDYRHPQKQEEEQNKLHIMRGVGQIKGRKSYDAFNFDMNSNNNNNNPYYDMNDLKKNMNSSSIASNMLIGHIGIICGVLFIFMSWRGATLT